MRFARETERAPQEKVRELYLAALNREPTAEETAFLVERTANYANPQQAWEDAIWAILNAKEFQFVR